MAGTDGGPWRGPDTAKWTERIMGETPNVARAGLTTSAARRLVLRDDADGLLLSDSITIADIAAIEQEAAGAALRHVRDLLFPLPLGGNIDRSRGREDERQDTLRIIDAAIRDLASGRYPT